MPEVDFLIISSGGARCSSGAPVAPAVPPGVPGDSGAPGVPGVWLSVGSGAPEVPGMGFPMGPGAPGVGSLLPFFAGFFPLSRLRSEIKTKDYNGITIFHLRCRPILYNKLIAMFSIVLKEARFVRGGDLLYLFVTVNEPLPVKKKHHPTFDCLDLVVFQMLQLELEAIFTIRLVEFHRSYSRWEGLDPFSYALLGVYMTS